MRACRQFAKNASAKSWTSRDTRRHRDPPACTSALVIAAAADYLQAAIRPETRSPAIIHRPCSTVSGSSRAAAGVSLRAAGGPGGGVAAAAQGTASEFREENRIIHSNYNAIFCLLEVDHQLGRPREPARVRRPAPRNGPHRRCALAAGRRLLPVRPSRIALESICHLSIDPPSHLSYMSMPGTTRCAFGSTPGAFMQRLTLRGRPCRSRGSEWSEYQGQAVSLTPSKDDTGGAWRRNTIPRWNSRCERVILRGQGDHGESCKGRAPRPAKQSL